MLTVGDKFKLNDEALDNYGEEFRDRVYTVTYVADHHVPSNEFFDSTSPRYREPGGHPGYDEGVSPMRLYDSEFRGAVYDWEIIPVKE